MNPNKIRNVSMRAGAQVIWMARNYMLGFAMFTQPTVLRALLI